MFTLVSPSQLVQGAKFWLYGRVHKKVNVSYYIVIQPSTK